MNLKLKVVRIKIDDKRTINVITNSKLGGFKSLLYPLLKTDKSNYAYVGGNGLGQIAATLIANHYQKPITLYYKSNEDDKYVLKASSLGANIVEGVDSLFLLTSACLLDDTFLMPIGLELDVVLKCNIKVDGRLWMLEGSKMVQGMFPNAKLMLIKKGKIGNVPFKTNTIEDCIWDTVLKHAKNEDYVWTSGIL